MEKAYDLKVLGEMVAARARASGLLVVEDGLEHLGADIFAAFQEWATQSAELTPTQIDNFAFSFLEKVKPFVDTQIVKLDLNGDGK